MWGDYSRRGGLPLSAEINVTSLVDLAFVLLIIFMITAPMLQSGVEVQLPRAEGAPIEASEGVVVTVARDGKIYIGNVPVASPEEFQRVFPDFVRARGVKDAFLRGDREVPYGRVLEVMGLLKKLDVVEVGLVADDPDQGR